MTTDSAEPDDPFLRPLTEHWPDVLRLAISRRHVTVGLEPDGLAWVRDEGSTNGTFIDDIRISPGSKAVLNNGAELRPASNMRATVQVRTDRG